MHKLVNLKGLNTKRAQMLSWVQCECLLLNLAADQTIQACDIKSDHPHDINLTLPSNSAKYQRHYQHLRLLHGQDDQLAS